MKMEYRPEIDGLRTLAVLSVILYHAEFYVGGRQLFQGGFFGVDVFFVISGFLITSLILNEYHATGRFSIARFYERRARRLLPALLAVILISIPFSLKYLLPTQLIDFSKSLIASLFFGSNFYWHNTLQEYGAESSLLKPFLHTWSLAVEEQYYILFPIILMSIYRWWRKYTIVILLAGLIMSLEFSNWMTEKDASFSFYMLGSRFWELLSGGMLANILYFHPKKNNDEFLGHIMPLLGLFLIVHSLFFIDISNHPGFITTVPVVGTVLIIWFSNENDLVTRVLSSKLFVGIGLISYSLYLWHYPVFAFGRIKNVSPSEFDKFEWMLLSLALSIATYFFVERVFRFNRKITIKIFLISMVIGVVFVLVFSLYVLEKEGLKGRFPELIKIYGQNVYDNKQLQQESWSILKRLANKNGHSVSYYRAYNEPFEIMDLWFSHNKNKHKILILGNSHSKDLFNAFYQNLDRYPEFEFARYGIERFSDKSSVNNLLNSPNYNEANTIIISHKFGHDLKSSLKNIVVLPDVINRFSLDGKKVILTSNTVEFENYNGEPLFDGYIKKYARKFSIDTVNKLFFDYRVGFIDRLNTELKTIAKKSSVVYLDKSEYMCDFEVRSCTGVTPDGFKSLYDGTHYTLMGAKYFGREIYELGWLVVE